VPQPHTSIVPPVVRTVSVGDQAARPGPATGGGH
jgi:hypothetical protein